MHAVSETAANPWGPPGKTGITTGERKINGMTIADARLVIRGTAHKPIDLFPSQLARAEGARLGELVAHLETR